MKKKLLVAAMFALLAGFSLFAQEEEVQPQAQLEQPAAPSQAPDQNTAPQIAPVPAPSVQPSSPAAAVPPASASLAVSGALQNYRIGRDMEARNRLNEANAYYAEAVRLCMAEINRNNTNDNSYTVLTWALLRQRKYAETVTWGIRALEMNANDYRIMETMGEAYFYLNDYGNSLRMMQRYVASMPRGDRASTAYFFMGEIYRNQQKYLHADIAYTTALNLESSIVLWWFRLGSVRESAGEFSGAIAAYEKALALSPGYREAGEGLERSRRQNAIHPPQIN
jgi:tetratricopeptide (TPR) repeat protein